MADRDALNIIFAQRREFAERVADYLETHTRYGALTKREVALEAVRLVLEDASDEAQDLMACRAGGGGGDSAV